MSEFEARVKMLEARAVEDTVPPPFLDEESVEIIQREREEEAQEVGFNARLLVQATLPHSKPSKGVHQFTRYNGSITLSVSSHPSIGLPYGTYPRLLLTWVTTEAVRTRSRELKLGRSLRSFMEKLGLAHEGGADYRRLRQHMASLFSSSFSALCTSDSALQIDNMLITDKLKLFWDPKKPDQESLWNSTLRLSEPFYTEITRKPVPVDLVALRRLARARSPLALDIYQWLTYRMSYLRQPTRIPWEALSHQFGSEYKRVIDFKVAFNRALRLVEEVYPEAKVLPDRKALQLAPSKTHVAQPFRA